MQVDIYDFDKTVVPFDSALKYWGFAMLHNPWIIIFLPFQVFWGILMGLHIISVETCKRYAFGFIGFINNEKTVQQYWDKYEKCVYDWFKPENRDRTTVLISASPDFLIEEIANRLGVEYVICTCHKHKYGKMQGRVCRRAEKVVRFREILPDAEVVNVYSDSFKSDKYIFALGKKCFLCTQGNLKEFAPPALDSLHLDNDLTEELTASRS